MQACLIHATNKGVTLQGREGKPIRLPDPVAGVLMQQRGYKKRLVPLETNGGQPIRRKSSESEPLESENGNENSYRLLVGH